MRQNHLKELDKSKIINQYQPHQIIFYANTQPYGLFCVQKGKVKIFKGEAKGEHSIVRLAGPGDLIGYRSLLADEPYTATAETLEETAICFFDKSLFFNILKSDAQITLNLIQGLARDLRHSEEQLTALAHKKVKERFTELLLRLKDKYGIKVDTGVKLDILLTRVEMAEMVSTTPESIIRQINEFKQEGLVEARGRYLILLDIPALKANVPTTAED